MAAYHMHALRKQRVVDRAAFEQEQVRQIHLYGGLPQQFILKP